MSFENNDLILRMSGESWRLRLNDALKELQNAVMEEVGKTGYQSPRIKEALRTARNVLARKERDGL